MSVADMFAEGRCDELRRPKGWLPPVPSRTGMAVAPASVTAAVSGSHSGPTVVCDGCMKAFDVVTVHDCGTTSEDDVTHDDVYIPPATAPQARST